MRYPNKESISIFLKPAHLKLGEVFCHYIWERVGTWFRGPFGWEVKPLSCSGMKSLGKHGAQELSHHGCRIAFLQIIIRLPKRRPCNGESLFPSLEAIERKQTWRGGHGQGNPIGEGGLDTKHGAPGQGLRTELAQRSPQGSIAWKLSATLSILGCLDFWFGLVLAFPA